MRDETMTRVETVRVGDVELQCIRGPDGEGYTAVRRMCEAMGVSFTGQRARLKNADWSCVKMIFTHDASGRKQELFCIPIRRLPMWFATMNARKVAPERRPQIERFQGEAAEALWQWMTGGQPAAMVPVDVQFAAMERRLESRIERRFDELTVEVRTARNSTDTISDDNVRAMRRQFLTVADWYVAARVYKTRRSASNALRAEIMTTVGWRGTGCRDTNMPAALWPIVRRLLEAAEQRARKALCVQHDDRQRTLFAVRAPAPRAAE